MVDRENTTWIQVLSEDGSARDEALEDLRRYLLKSLAAALKSWKRKIPGKYDALIEDAVQDALVKILNSLASFRGESRFTTWAAKIAVRTALTELRRKKWRDISLETVTENVNGMLMDKRSYADPEHGALRKELMDTMTAMMADRLTEKQRIAMKAVVFGGMPLEEAARRMDTNRNALYKLLHDARSKMKSALSDAGMTPADFLSKYTDAEVRLGSQEASL